VRGPSGAEDHRARFSELVGTFVREAGRVRLFAHRYSGRVDTEKVGACRGQTLALDTFDDEGGAFPVDTVVEVVKRAG